MSYTAIHLELKRKRKGVKGIPHLQEQRRKMMKKEVEGLFRENLVVGLDVAHVWTTIIDANDEFQCDYVTKCHPASVYPQDWHFEEECVKSEIRVLQKCSQCVEMGLTPNLPMHYGSCIAPTRVKTRFDKSGRDLPPFAYYSANELAGGPDLEMWQMGEAHGPLQWTSCFFQILAGAAVLNGMVRYVHADLHWGNVIMQPLNPGGCWHYKLGRQSYYVPNTGEQWRLWDFGFSLPIKNRRDVLKTLEDIDNVLLGCFQFPEKDKPWQHPTLVGGHCKHTIERALKKAKRRFYSLPRNMQLYFNFPATVIELLGWFKIPPKDRGTILNPRKPYSLSFLPSGGGK